eukprot:PhF_6_TR19271/c0_g1_i1/m.28335/K18826/CAMKMT; calmodulin-lysine N-methyltransferase
MSADGEKFDKQWKALRSFLTKKGTGSVPGKSSMRFNPFNVVRSTVTGIVDASVPNSGEVLLFEAVDYECEGVVAQGVLRRREGRVNVSDLAVAKQDGVDNTGSFHWPTEEALAYYLLKYQSNLFLPDKGSTASERMVLEIGAGSGVAGFLLNSAIHRYTENSKNTTTVILSDGNAGVCQTLDRAIHALPSKEQQTTLKSHQILWHDPSTYNTLNPSFVFGSDCFFFDQYHNQLADMLCCFKQRNSELVVVMMAPRRGNTLETFVEIIRSRQIYSDIVVEEKYDEHMWRVHEEQMAQVPEQTTQYSPDKNYPLVVIMR